MVSQTERFNNRKVLPPHMAGVSVRYSLREIRNFIEKSLDNFAREHETELVRIVKEDEYSDVPSTPSYEQFYFDELVPKVRGRMTQSGFNEEEIKSMVGYGDALFYRSILPSVCRNYRERSYSGVR